MGRSRRTRSACFGEAAASVYRAVQNAKTVGGLFALLLMPERATCKRRAAQKSNVSSR